MQLRLLSIHSVAHPPALQPGPFATPMIPTVLQHLQFRYTLQVVIVGKKRITV